MISNFKNFGDDFVFEIIPTGGRGNKNKYFCSTFLKPSRKFRLSVTFSSDSRNTEIPQNKNPRFRKSMTLLPPPPTLLNLTDCLDVRPTFWIFKQKYDKTEWKSTRQTDRLDNQGNSKQQTL